MDLGSLVSTVGGAATGGILGTLGSLGTQAASFFIDREKAKQALEAKKVDYAHELELLDKQQERGRQEAQESFAAKVMDGKIAEIQASFAGLTASMQDQQTLSGKASQWVVDVMTFVRPSLTLLLIAEATVFGLTDNANAFYQSSLMASLAVAWWFGDRQSSQNRTLFTPTQGGK